jgi:hypothetical protein
MPDFKQDRQAIGVSGAGDVLPANVPLSAVGRNFDLVFVVLGTAVALALRAPALGVLVGAAGWLVQRVLAMADRRLIVRAAEPGSRLGLNFADAFARIWVLAGAIVIAAAVGGRRDGLAAAVLIFATYSLAFALRLGRGRPEVDRQ